MDLSLTYFFDWIEEMGSFRRYKHVIIYMSTSYFERLNAIKLGLVVNPCAVQNVQIVWFNDDRLQKLYQGRLLYGEDVVWGGCGMGRVLYGEGVVWGGCGMGRVWYGEGVVWGGCCMWRVWYGEDVVWEECDMGRLLYGRVLYGEGVVWGGCGMGRV